MMMDKRNALIFSVNSISRPVENAALRVISFGAGVQSTVMLLMAARGEIGPMPDVAIFADTGWESGSLYKHASWCQDEVSRLTGGKLGIDVVSGGDIRKDHLNGLNSTGQRFASMPLHTSGGGMGRRQCTREYKIDPIRRRVRELLGVDKGKRVPKGVMVEQWIGISTDEIQRLKDSSDKWVTNRWPLIEMRMSRSDCRAWFSREYPGRPLAKSSCLGCPYKSNHAWKDLKRNDPLGWRDVCEFDQAIRESGSKLRGMNEQQYVHRSLVPLVDADLNETDTVDLFTGECDGMCGT